MLQFRAMPRSFLRYRVRSTTGTGINKNLLNAPPRTVDDCHRQACHQWLCNSTTRGCSSTFNHPFRTSRFHRSFATSSSSSNDGKNIETADNDDTGSFTYSEDWIPPNRPLAGDQGGVIPVPPAEQQQSQDTARALEEALFVIDDNDSEDDIQRKLAEALQLEETLEQQTFEQELQIEEAYEQRRQLQQSQQEQQQQQEQSVDWLSTRRKALGRSQDDNDDVSRQEIIPVREHELLTQEEFISLLEYHKGMDIQVLLDDPETPRMGGGTQGMIVCGATSSFHLQSMTKALIDHLKERNLQQHGVLGAQMNSNHFSPRRSTTTSSNTTTWNVVDCRNFVVHFVDEATRQALRLEELWSGKDPLWTLNVQNEDEVDQYVYQHPVPSTYGYHPQSLWDISKLERNQFVPHTPVVPSLQKKQDRRMGRRKRREMKQGY